MIQILIEGHDYKYEVGELLKLFVPADEIKFYEHREALDKDQSFLLVSKVIEEEASFTIESMLDNQITSIMDRQEIIIDLDMDLHQMRKKIKKAIKVSLFNILSKYYGIAPPWGILTGIRPSKIVHELLDQGLDLKDIKSYLRSEYKISKAKIDLVTQVAMCERTILEQNDDTHISLYVSIPFCPTRCLYCSFPSNPLDKGKRELVNDYLEALFYEISSVGKLLKELNKKIDTLYIGGGTPTSLTSEELDLLFHEIKNHFELSFLREITVEAGRPDTIDANKLRVLKNHGVDRISINPQTMSAVTLETIGRSHSPQDIIDTFRLAKDIGFRTINMDLIIGLPNETPMVVEDTMKAIMELKPENLTVHTLAVKKSSRLKEKLEEYQLIQEEQAKNMLDITQEYAKKMGLMPYYMYRQKYMVGNLENIGYSLPGQECIYNIQIIEEKQTIIALGAGGISKVYYPKENRLERVPNITNVEQYISRIEEMIERKRAELNKAENTLTDKNL